MCFVYKHEDMNFTSNLLLFSILTELRFAWKSLNAEGLMLMNLGNGFLKLFFSPFVVYIYWEVLETVFVKKKNTSTDKEATFDKNTFLENWAESTELP